MKIICEKGYHAGNVLRLVAEYLEKRYPDDMILDENMEITLSLKNGKNGQPIVLGEEELQLSYHTADHSEDYYNHDVLTHLYTRCKYEHDLKVFQLANEINNHLGHEAGDHMLRSIADGIRKYFPDDCAYRIGGDEFAVMLDINLSPDQLEHLLTQFLRDISGILEQVTVSCSIGAYRFVFPQEIKHLLTETDRVLYQAKENGRACFVIEDSTEK